MQVIRSGVITTIALIFFMSSMNARRVNAHNEWPQWTEQHQLNGLDVTMRGLSKAETKKLFDTRGKRLLRRKHKIRPIEMKIENKNEKEITTSVSDVLAAINFSEPLHDVSRIINAPRRSLPRALVFGLLGTIGVGVGITCVSSVVVGALFSGISSGGIPSVAIFNAFVAPILGAYFGILGAIPVAPTAGYLIGSKYSIVDNKQYAITDIAQPITLEPGQKVQVYVFVDAKSALFIRELSLIDYVAIK